MDNLLRNTAVLLVFHILTTGAVFAAEPNNITPEKPQVKAAVIVCSGDIDYGLYQSIKRRTRIAFEQGAQYIILKIGTYGGLIESADDISKYLILDIPQINKNAHTVAYVDTEAISAGAMISVSCRDIIMRTNTTIGDSAPISLTGTIEGVEREKIESFTRTIFDRAAEANNYPRALLRAMVTMQIEVYRLKNLQTGEYEFFEGDSLPNDPNIYDLDNKELVDSDDKLLTLTASEAYEYGIARAIVADVNEAIDFLAERDDVSFSGDILLLETTWSEEVARWLNSPAIMAVLVLLAMLGVYMELSSPGLGLPGLVAVISVVLIVGSKYIGGLANWIEVVFLIVGIILLLIEFFVIPGFGITGIIGIILIFAGLFGMLIKNPPDIVPWPQTENAWNDFTWGIMGLALGVGGFTVIVLLFSKYFTRIPLLSGLILVPGPPQQDVETSGDITSQKIRKKSLKVNVGDRGYVVSALWPVGKAKFGEDIVDVIAIGQYIEKDEEVEIAEIHGNRIVVKAVSEN